MRFCCLVLVGSLAVAARGAERTWTDVQGRTMRAEFVREINGEATFLKDGKLVTVPLDRLSQADRQMVRALESGAPLPSESPPVNPFALPGDAADNAANGSAKNSSNDSFAGRGEAPSTLTKPKPVPIVNRSWSDARGASFTAKFVRVFDGKVVLSRSGKIVTLPFYDLSPADQDHVKELLTSRGQESLIPPPPPPPRDVASRPAEEAMPAPRGGGFVPSSADSGRNPLEEMRERREQQQRELQERLSQQRQEREDQEADRKQKAAERAQQAAQDLEQRRQQQEQALGTTVVAHCPACNQAVTYEQMDLGACPQCNAPWRVERDGFGRPRRLYAGVPKKIGPLAAGWTMPARVQPTPILAVMVVGGMAGIAIVLMLVVATVASVMRANAARNY